MCFLKSLNDIPQVWNQPSSPCRSDKNSLLTDFHSESKDQEKKAMKVDSGLMLLSCINMVALNSQFLFLLDQKLNQATQLLDSAQEFLEQYKESEKDHRFKRPQNFEIGLPTNRELNLFQATDPLTTKLFGEKSYKYRLSVSGDFSNALYKERNFGCSIKLIDIETGKQQNNGNIINICFGVCDNLGEWIHETKEGQAFIKGKIETELYHGSAQFVRLSPRDVSRAFPDKTVNIVVYPKPSVLKYSGESSIEQHIDFNLVEPLVIRDVCIKAKKRE